MNKKLVKKLSAANILVFLLVVLSPFLFVEKAQSAAFAQAYVRFDRLKASTATTGLVCAKTRSGNTESENDVQVTFPSDFTVSTTLGNWTVSTTDIPFGASTWTGILTATAADNGTKIVTFPSGLLSADTLYCFRWTNTSALTTGSSGNNKTGNIKTRTSGPATIESNDYATSIVSDDQIVITATVPATFTFVLSGNTDALGNLSDSSIVSSPTPRTVTITTNAAQGWVAWVKSANAALNSASTGANIATAGTVNDTPEDLDSVIGYVLDVDKTSDASGGCTLQQNPGYGDEYDGTDATQGGSLSTTFQPIAECVSGTANGDVITLANRVKISATQAAAADYTDTLTVVAAGRF